MVKFRVFTINDSTRGRLRETAAIFDTKVEAERFVTEQLRPALGRDTSIGIQEVETDPGTEVVGPVPSQRGRQLKREREQREARGETDRERKLRKQKALTDINTRIERGDVSADERRKLIEQRQRVSDIPASQFTQGRLAETKREPEVKRDVRIITKAREPTRKIKKQVVVRTGAQLTTSTLSLTPGGDVASFEFEPTEGALTKQQFTPKGLITEAPRELKFKSFFTTEKQIQFEKEGAFGKVKSFVSGGGQLLGGFGKSIVAEFPKRKKKKFTPKQAAILTIATTPLKQQFEFVNRKISGLGQAITETVRTRPFAVAGQIALVELGLRGARKVRVKSIERQPVSVRLGTKGELFSIETPKEPGARLTRIKPVEFEAETGGEKIAGIGRGIAKTTRTGELVAGFEFKTRTTRGPRAKTEVAIKGKIERTATGTKGRFISETVTRTPLGKEVKQRAIVGARSEEIIGGQFPVSITTAGEIRKGRLGISALGESIDIRRLAQPKFVRAGVVRKEAEFPTSIVFEGKPVQVTGERFGFLEKGISAKALRQRERAIIKAEKLTDKQRVAKVRAGGVFDVGGLIPPIEIPRPTPKLKRLVPETIISKQFLEGIRGAVKAERIAAIPRIRNVSLANIVSGVDTRFDVDFKAVQKAEARLAQERLPRVISKIKPTVESAVKQTQRVGLLSALKPVQDVVQAQQVKPRLTTLQKFSSLFITSPIPITPPVPRPTPFFLPLPKVSKVKDKKKKKRFGLQRGFAGTPSLSVVLGGAGVQLTPGQIVGKQPISPFLIRKINRRS